MCSAGFGGVYGIIGAAPGGSSLALHPPARQRHRVWGGAQICNPERARVSPPPHPPPSRGRESAAARFLLPLPRWERAGVRVRRVVLLASESEPLPIWELRPLRLHLERYPGG